MKAAGDSHSVLVLEDDDAVRNGMVTLLRRGGHEVIAARTVAEGWAALDAASPTHLVLDFNLPDGVGTEVLRRALDRGMAVHAVLLTGTTDPDLLDKAMAAGIEAVFVKPPDWDELLGWVGRA